MTRARADKTVTARGCYESASENPGCRVCGAALTHEVVLLGERYVLPDDARKRYCSPACKQAAYRQRLEWNAAYLGAPDGLTLRERNRARRSRSERVYFDPGYDAGCYCAACGRSMPHKLRSDAKYCSPACRQRAYRNRRTP